MAVVYANRVLVHRKNYEPAARLIEFWDRNALLREA
jgi:hypothetical protein